MNEDLRCEGCAYPVEGLAFVDYGKYVLCSGCDAKREQLKAAGILPATSWDEIVEIYPE
jgi:hypothetical protein